VKKNAGKPNLNSKARQRFFVRSSFFSKQIADFLTYFTSTARNATQKNSNKTGVIVGAVIGAAVLGLVVLTGLYVWRQQSKKLSLEQQGT
jgi:hypothetical protein